MPRKRVVPLDPDTPAGKAAAEALSEVLAEIQVAIWRREAAGERTPAPAASEDQPCTKPCTE